jgi:chromosome segregation ATPase
MHTLDCPAYLASMTALEARQAAARPFASGGIVRPSGEPTSAALRRVTAERDEALAALSRLGLALTKARHAIDALKVDTAEARIDADAARAELESARTELALIRRQRDTLRADLDRARNRAEAAERALTYVVGSGDRPDPIEGATE